MACDQSRGSACALGCDLYGLRTFQPSTHVTNDQVMVKGVCDVSLIPVGTLGRYVGVWRDCISTFFTPTGNHHIVSKPLAATPKDSIAEELPQGYIW